MAILLTAHEVSKTFASRTLFESISFTLQSGERIGLIGPNGAGKSTLLKILAQQMDPDHGKVSFTRGLKVGLLAQVPEWNPGATVFEVATEKCADSGDWEAIGLAQESLSRMGFESLIKGVETPMEELSGGWQKKATLARELATRPDLLLLDEPTNHLDLETILWLEDFLPSQSFATLTITHDRYFLDRVSTRILELDRRNPGGLLSVEGDYAKYLETKESLLATQLSREASLKNTLRRETEWLKRGAKARTTKQQARIKRHGELSDELSQVSARTLSRTARMEFTDSSQSPKKLIEAKEITLTRGEKTLFKDLDIILRPGTRVGLLGPNGCGKSSLIQTLIGKLKPNSGTVQLSDGLKVAYFEQSRDALDPKASLQKTLAPTGEFVEYRGGRIHVRSYMERFLFNPEQAVLSVGKLSGGEQARLLLAMLMLQPANLLVLDEPTNDLDLATLALLEDCLVDFDGAVLLVSHDRFFVDRVCNRLLAFDVHADLPDERIIPFADLAQWEAWMIQTTQERASPNKANAAKRDALANASGPPAKRKLSFKEQREWDTMEATIAETEAKIQSLHAELEDPKIQSAAGKLQEATQKLGKETAKLDSLFARWAELEALRG